MHDHAPHDHDHGPATGHAPHDAPFATAHDHVFLGADHDRNARRTWIVIAITATMMVVEIVAGTIYGSMALVADGWHMSTHAAALLIAALSYRYARRHANNPRFTFGTGKLGDLAGFASAVLLMLIAALIAWESAIRLTSPVTIDYTQATIVAVMGLAVNLACAALLFDRPHGHDHGHGHGHHDDHGHGHSDHGDHPVKARDNNIRAAYLHVLADALTSVLAIAALLMGSAMGWLWLDPAIGILGAVIIAHWSIGLMRGAGAVLVDYLPPDQTLSDKIRHLIERGDERITDLHVWQLGPGHHGAIVSIRSPHPQPVSNYRARLAPLAGLSHVTVEIEAI